MERESILMYRSTREMLMDLKREDPEQYMTAIEMYMDYAFDGTEPELSGKSLVTKLFWKASKPLIDANNKNYVNGCKGGAPKGNKNNSTGKNQYSNKRTTQGQPKDNPSSTQGQRNVNENVNENANVSVNVDEHVNDNANDNVNVNVKERNPYIDINTMSITDFDKYDEWNREHGIEG
jgi:hypothetical protein